jgi:hypothetical protein
VVKSVLGDYAIPAPANFLLAGRDKHETEIARLAGARFVVCSEINQGTRFDEAKVKLLTGGDTLTGAVHARKLLRLPAVPHAVSDGQPPAHRRRWWSCVLASGAAGAVHPPGARGKRVEGLAEQLIAASRHQGMT